MVEQQDKDPENKGRTGRKPYSCTQKMTIEVLDSQTEERNQEWKSSKRLKLDAARG